MLTRAACECGSWAKTVVIETVTDRDCWEFTSEERSIFYVRDVRNCLLEASDRWRFVLSLVLLQVSLAQVVVFAVAVCTARVRFRVCRCSMHCSIFRVCRCCMRCPRKFSCLQLLYALPAQMSVFAGAVCTARSSFRVCRCCMRCLRRLSW